MTDEELAEYGYEVCEFTDVCDDCEEEIPQGELFFHRTSPEYMEGDYFCRTCASKSIQSAEEFYDDFNP
jgi:hypothetical protein